MAGLGDFILTICAASAASAVLNAIMPEGGTKKYVNLLVSLAILLILLSPLKSVRNVAQGDMSLGASHSNITEVMTMANGIVARRIGAAVSEKFSVAREQVTCEYKEDGVTVRMPARIGIIKEDVKVFIANRFGVVAEVILYER